MGDSYYTYYQTPLCSQNQSQGSWEQMRDNPLSINVPEQNLPMGPMYLLGMDGNYAQGVQPTQLEYPKLAEGIMQPGMFLSPQSVGCNMPYQCSPPYQYLYPMGPNVQTQQPQCQFFMLVPNPINDTQGYQYPANHSTKILPEQTGQGLLQRQQQSYQPPIQFLSPITNLQGPNASIPSAGLLRINTGIPPGGNPNQLVMMTKNWKGKPRNGVGPGANRSATTKKSQFEQDKEPSKQFIQINLVKPKHFLSINLNEKNNGLKLPEDLFTEGSLMKILAIECDYLNSEKQDHLLSIIENCPNVEELKLKFNSFRTKNYKPELLSFTSVVFKCTDLKNLTSFQFKSKVSKKYPRSLDLHKDASKFNANVFMEIMKSSDNLKTIVLRTSQLAYYLEAMTGDSEIPIKLKQLHTLRLHTEQTDDGRMFNTNALMKLLSIVSSSLETLHLCGVTWTDLSSYPTMAKLKTLAIQSNVEYSKLSLSTQSLPQLKTLILRHMEYRENLNFDFGWPMDEEIFKVDPTGNGITEDQNPPLLNVVLYVKWTSIQNWKMSLDQFLLKISQVNAESLFIDVPSYHGSKRQVVESMKESTFMSVLEKSSLKRCSIRSVKVIGEPPTVIEML